MSSVLCACMAAKKTGKHETLCLKVFFACKQRGSREYKEFEGI